MRTGTVRLQSLPLNSEKALSQRGELVVAVTRQTNADVDALARTLTNNAVRAYKREYNQMLAQAGTSRRLIVIDEETYQQIATNARKTALQIHDTFNRDLASKVERILVENANYTKKEVLTRLQAWNLSRESHKAPTIALWNELSAVDSAHQDFFRQNPTVEAVAKASPDKAVCQDCQRLVAMGEVPVEVSLANPFPLHPNCVHRWEIRIKKGTGEVRVNSWWQQLLGRLRR